MIFNLIVQAVVDFMNEATASFLPHVDKLPFGIDAILVAGFGYIHFLVTIGLQVKHDLTLHKYLSQIQAQVCITTMLLC